MHPTTDPRPRRALEDASGRRLRRMRWIGRAVALVFLLWFAAILLGALGVGPAGRVPFGSALRPSPGPPPLRRLPPPRQPTPADLVPARPATAVAPPVRRHTPARAAKQRVVRGHSALAPGQLKAKARGRSSVAPERLKPKARGGSSVAPGQLKAKARGRSSSAPSRVRARAGAAPGRLHRTARTATTTGVTTTSVTTTTPGRGRAVGHAH